MHVFQLRNSARLSEKKANGNSVREQRIRNRERIDCPRYIVQREDARDKPVQDSCSDAMGSDGIRVQTKVAMGKNANEETLERKADIMARVEMHLRIKS